LFHCLEQWVLFYTEVWHRYLLTFSHTPPHILSRSVLSVQVSVALLSVRNKRKKGPRLVEYPPHILLASVRSVHVSAAHCYPRSHRAGGPGPTDYEINEKSYFSGLSLSLRRPVNIVNTSTMGAPSPPLTTRNRPIRRVFKLCPILRC
jgi:hypothetical protein